MSYSSLKRFFLGISITWIAGCAGVPVDAPQGKPIALKNAAFIADATGAFPGWRFSEHMAGNSYTFVADRDAPHSAPTSLRIRRHGPEFFGLVEQMVPVQPEWIDHTVRLSGYLRTAGATGTGAALVLQVRDGSANILRHDHMDDRRVRGDTGWTRYAVQLKVVPGAHHLQVGAMLQDDGTMWVDDLALELVD